MKYTIYTFIAILLLISCGDEKGCMTKWDLPPIDDVRMAFERDGSLLTSDEMAVYRLYVVFNTDTFIDPGAVRNIVQGKDPFEPGLDDSLYLYNYREYFGESSSTYAHLFFMRYVQTHLRVEGIKGFYLEHILSGRTYEIGMESEEVNNCEAKDEECYCRLPLRHFYFDGEVVFRDDALSETYDMGRSVFRLILD